MGYGAYAQLWRDAAARAEGGKRAYALKTAAMWEGMKDRCARQYETSRRAEVNADALDQTRVSGVFHVMNGSADTITTRSRSCRIWSNWLTT